MNVKFYIDLILQVKEKMIYKESKVQDQLNSLLQVALPIMFHHIDVFKDRQCTDKDMHKYLPKDRKNASEIVLEGKWPIKVYKSDWLRFYFQDKNAIDDGILGTKYKSISSYCKYQSKSIFSSSFLW